MNINCINNKIATANGVLQPIILQSIKDIYLNDNHQMTARMVRNQCIIIDNNIQWNGKPAAICNAMRNAIECGGRIVGEDRDFLDFTIAFDGNNLEISTPKKTSPKAETNKKEKTNSSSIPPYINEIEIEKLNLSKNFKVVMACAGRKNISFFTSYPRENFVDSPINNSEHHPDDTMNKEEISWRKYLLNNQNDINLKQAFELYLPIRYPNVYVDLYTKFNANFYILSAGWGLINSEFRLPEYNITFSENNNILPNYRRNKNLTIQPIYNDFNQLVVNDEDDIVLLGGKDYRNLFYKLTQHTPNRKVIFYKEQITPQLPRFVINRQTFIFVKYTPDNPNNNHDWYYELGTRI
jgi:hypothetical protein